MGKKIDALDLRDPWVVIGLGMASDYERLLWGDWGWTDEPAPYTPRNRINVIITANVQPLLDSLSRVQHRLLLSGTPHRSKSWRWRREHWWIRFLRRVTGIQRQSHIIMFEGERDALEYLHHQKVT